MSLSMEDPDLSFFPLPPCSHITPIHLEPWPWLHSWILYLISPADQVVEGWLPSHQTPMWPTAITATPIEWPSDVGCVDLAVLRPPRQRWSWESKRTRCSPSSPLFLSPLLRAEACSCHERKWGWDAVWEGHQGGGLPSLLPSSLSEKPWRDNKDGGCCSTNGRKGKL